MGMPIALQSAHAAAVDKIMESPHWAAFKSPLFAEHPVYSQIPLVTSEVTVYVAPKTAPVIGLVIEKTALVNAVMPADPAIEPAAPRVFKQFVAHGGNAAGGVS